MMLIISYAISIAVLIPVVTMGIVLYRRYIADRARRRRNALRVAQMAVCAAVGAAQTNKIRSTSYKCKIQINHKKLHIANTIVNTANSMAHIIKGMEPKPEYRIN